MLYHNTYLRRSKDKQRSMKSAHHNIKVLNKVSNESSVKLNLVTALEIYEAKSPLLFLNYYIHHGYGNKWNEKNMFSQCIYTKMMLYSYFFQIHIFFFTNISYIGTLIFASYTKCKTRQRHIPVSLSKSYNVYAWVIIVCKDDDGIFLLLLFFISHHRLISKFF